MLGAKLLRASPSVSPWRFYSMVSSRLPDIFYVGSELPRNMLREREECFHDLASEATLFVLYSISKALT